MSQEPESQNTPAGPTAADTPSLAPSGGRTSAASVFSNAVLMLFGAILLAGGYFLSRVYAPPRPPGEVTGPAFGGVQPDEFKALAGRVDGLKAQVEGASTKAGDRPGPDPATKDLRDKVEDLARTLAEMPARLDSLDKKVEAAGKAAVEAPSPRLDALDRHVGDLARAVDALRSEAAAKPAPAASGPGTGPAVAVAAAPTAEAAAEDRAIEQAGDLFKQRKYPEAAAAFTRLQSNAADDARVWYYSALANGLATKQWLGETERLVNAGLEREKVGSPDLAKIDAAFAGLTTATGKDWLAAYRKRIAPR